MHPTFYGEKRTIESDDYNMVRDEFEMALLAEIIRQEKPNYGDLPRLAVGQCYFWWNAQPAH